MRPIVCILSKSGSGKTTLCAELEKRYGLKSIPSYTTRSPRFEGEQGHTFITEQEFDNLKDILAYAETDKCRYAVTKKMFEDENYSLYVVDMSGLKYLYKHYKGERPIISIYINCDVYDRFKHMVYREDTRTYYERMEAALNRIEHDATEFNEGDIKKYVGYTLTNYEDQFDRLVGMVKRICENYGIIKESK